MSDPVRKGVELLATSCFYLANFLFLQCDLSRIELARIIRLTLENLLSVQTDPIRSTNLDSWTNAQLRLMKVGGNGNATEFFASHGGNHLLAPSTEGKLKYTSAVANLYKEELSKRALADAKGLPLSSPVHFPGLAASQNSSSNNNSNTNGKESNGGKDDDDFFDDWDKPASSTSKPKAEVSKPVGVPGIGRARPTATASTPAPTPTPAAPIPRQTTSSSRPSSGTSTPTGTAPRRGAGLGAVRTGATSTSSRGGKLGLGVKRGAAPVDFEAAERKAKEEEAERLKREEEEEKERQEALNNSANDEIAKEMAKKAIEAATKTVAAGGAASNPTAGLPKSPTSPVGRKSGGGGRESAEVERLGMGFGRMQLQNEAKRRAEEETLAIRKARDASNDDVSYARNKFSSQKSISSDQYFQRGNYDANAQNEAQERLKNFKGQTSISSNQYFGREDDEDGENGEGGYSTGGAGGGEDFGQDLEATAREYYTRFMANPDVQQGIESFRAGAMKVSSEKIIFRVERGLRVRSHSFLTSTHTFSFLRPSFSYLNT